MSEIINEHIADSLSDYSIHSEDSDIEVEDSDSDVDPRRKSIHYSIQAIPMIPVIMKCLQNRIVTVKYGQM